ncbi:hypothetical protein [Methanohalophilus mahii]|uniref:Uncharacterized protein n=1 Tax=Methanohalophilus mahii (strain ATCC 35705 / DSM 5219 / SLP) TaxID=547558 RepID=D5EB74_METMS|nr:hypothetical protein [Methanohalophilus mahii]ADE36425.1 hypothetical protein Mmah_0904 [Methanohalophilus mahii DSM 5219]
MVSFGDVVDVVAGVATGGLYTLGKSIYESSESAGDAAEAAGISIAIIGSTIQSVGEQLNSFLQETEELISIKRLSPRAENDLWEEEKDRLDELKVEKQELLQQLQSLGVEDPLDFSFNFWDMISDMENVLEKFEILSRIAAINAQIMDILYKEPGVLTSGIYNAKEVLERLNTVEQPMIEDVLGGIDDNLEVSEEVLTEAKKLFVTREKVPISITDLKPAQKLKLDRITARKAYFNDLIERKDEVASSLQSVMKEMPAAKFEKNKDIIQPAGMIDASDYLKFPKSGVLRQYSSSFMPVSDDDEVKRTFNPDDLKINEEKRFAKIDTGKEDYKTEEVSALKDKIPASTEANISAIRKSLGSSGKLSLEKVQPAGARVSASIATKFDGYQRNFDHIRAQRSLYERQLHKIEKEELLLTHVWKDTPGIIPQALDEAHEVLESVHSDQQPRINTVLDNLNDNLEESKETLSKANDTMDSVQQSLSIFDFNTTWLKYGVMAIGGLVVLNLLMGLIVLTRSAFGI